MEMLMYLIEFDKKQKKRAHTLETNPDNLKRKQLVLSDLKTNQEIENIFTNYSLSNL
jgi:hypothetical protein